MDVFAVGVQTWAGTTTRGERHDVQAMLEYLLVLLSFLGSAVRDREALVAENLLLRHQLTVLTRPTRKRPRLRARDKLFWVVVRALRRDWRRHLVRRPTRERHPLAWPGLAALLALA